MAIEYATTSAELTREEYYSSDSDRTYREDVPDRDLTPRAPDDGWILVGAACSKTRVFWFWQKRGG